MLTAEKLSEIERDTQEFEEKLVSGYFKLDTLHNSEVNYRKEKEGRDTRAVSDFLKSDLAVYIANME